MRRPRIRLQGETAVYHCMSRAAGGQFIFKKHEKDFFRRHMMKVARFCGIKFLSFSVMGNHYHQVVKVPARVKLSDLQLKRRVADYYGRHSPEYRLLKRASSGNGPDYKAVKEKFLNMMGDVSVFQKLVKQRFSIWYNDRNNRQGTLWMGRFKSVLVENNAYARMCVSAYVDLNAVRAGIVSNPAAYPHCSYSEALLGNRSARAGICTVTGFKRWEEASKAYRKFISQRGVEKVKSQPAIARGSLLRELEDQGHLPVADLLHLRLRFFSDGLAIGRESFLKRVVAELPKRLMPDCLSDSHNLAGGNWNSLKALQQFRKPVIF